jgi:hypothetical protein
MGVMNRDKIGEFLRALVPAAASTTPTSAARSR